MHTAQARFTLSCVPRAAGQPGLRPGHRRWPLGLSGSQAAKVGRPYRPSATSSRPGEHQMPGVAVVGHVGVLVAVEATSGQLCRRPSPPPGRGARRPGPPPRHRRPAGSGSPPGVKNRNRPSELQAGHRPPWPWPRPRCPAASKTSKSGIAPDHLRGRAPTLAGQPRRLGRLLARAQIGQVMRCGQVAAQGRIVGFGGHGQSSLLSSAASSPMPPTMVISPGAEMGGPMGRL